jgi:hypothetical protein
MELEKFQGIVGINIQDLQEEGWGWGTCGNFKRQKYCIQKLQSDRGQ